MRATVPKLFPRLALLSVLASLFWEGTAYAQSAAAGQRQPELIVLLAQGKDVPTPEQVVDSARRGQPLTAGLQAGNPVRARFLIQERAAGAAREALLEEPDTPAARLERYVVLTYPVATDTAALARQLRKLRGVISVEPNQVYELAVTPNDPLSQPRTTPYEYQWGLPTLGLSGAWDQTPDWGHGYVGVLDTGIDTTHEDLRENTTPGQFGTGNFRAHLSWDFGYDDANVDEGQYQTPDPTCSVPVPPVVGVAGHGTHVAGIVAATPNNDLGVAGVCGSCSLLIGKVSKLGKTDVNGSCQYANSFLQTTTIAAGIKGLVDRGAQSLSMSFGLPNNFPDCSESNAFCDALAYASDRDVLMAAASGNGGATVVDFPARDPRVIAVGGIVPGGAFWGSCDSMLDVPNSCPSNSGPEQELAAPARQVLSTFYRGIPYTAGCTDSAGFGGPGYGPCSGTSMSTPHITAAATLLRSINPLLSQGSIRTLLIQRASQNGVHENERGYGFPSVAASVADILGTVAGHPILNRLTPLFSLYSPQAEDSFATTVPQMAAAAYHDTQAAYGTSGPAVPGYPQFPGVSCSGGSCLPAVPGAAVYVFTTPSPPRSDLALPPLVPLYRLSFRGPNSMTGNPLNRDVTYTTDAAGIQAFEGVGYKWDGIEGYLYKPCTPETTCIPAGAVQLLRRYHPQRNDFAIFPASELPQMEAQGYTSTGGVPGVLGYAYPNADADGDHLIDGFETLLGTNPTQSDSDCDGLTDGQEVLNFPYGDPLGASSCQPLAVEWISQSVPTSMVTGQTYPVSLTVKNAGSQAWSPIGSQCNAFRLGSSNPQDNTTWGFNRVELPATVPPGQQVTISFTVTAPAQPLKYNFQWQMTKECVQWFGSASPNVSVSVKLPTPVPLDVAWISQSVPTTMVAGQSYPVSLTLRNAGTQTWSSIGSQCNAFRLGSSNPQSNTIWGFSRVDLPTTVIRGYQVTIPFTVTTPASPGLYNFQWQMLQECGAWFGSASPNVTVNVQ